MSRAGRQDELLGAAEGSAEPVAGQGGGSAEVFALVAVRRLREER